MIVSDSNAIGGEDEALEVQQEEGTGSVKIINSTISTLDLEGVEEI